MLLLGVSCELTQNRHHHRQQPLKALFGDPALSSEVFTEESSVWTEVPSMEELLRGQREARDRRLGLHNPIIVCVVHVRINHPCLI